MRLTLAHVAVFVRIDGEVVAREVVLQGFGVFHLSFCLGRQGIAARVSKILLQMPVV